VNLYQILNVQPTASQEEIKKAYRRLAMKHHPDRNHGNKEASTEMQDIQRAYDVLGDPERRKRYDETGATEDGPSPEKTAKEELAKLFISLANSQDADTFDFKKGASSGAKDIMRKIESQIQDLRRNLKNTEKARKRLKRKTEGEPFLLQVLDAHARQTREKIAYNEQNMEVVGIMLKMLDDYEYEVEVHQNKQRSLADIIAQHGSYGSFNPFE
jgi:curved DNA-binding protein CbpA